MNTIWAPKVDKDVGDVDIDVEDVMQSIDSIGVIDRLLYDDSGTAQDVEHKFMHLPASLDCLQQGYPNP